MLETDRLILRRPNASDLPDWGRFMADSQATRFIGGPLDVGGAWRNLCMFAGAWDIRGYSNFSIIEKATGRWIGRVGPWYTEDWPGQEIGWALDRSAWGHGYATEAASRCLDWVFKELGWIVAIHLIHPDNRASIAVALRLGAQLRSSRSNNGALVFGLTREKWFERGSIPIKLGFIWESNMASTPELLLLHALPMDSSMWQAQMGILSGATFSPTLYGFGDRLEAWAKEALKFAKGDRIVVVGCSVGGSCALEVTALAPDRVAAIVLIGTKAARRMDSAFHQTALENAEGWRHTSRLGRVVEAGILQQGVGGRSRIWSGHCLTTSSE